MSDNRLVESWVWFGFAASITLLRYVSRVIRLGGWTYFELEDYIMVLGLAFYTNLIVWINIQSHHSVTNILPPTGTAGMSRSEIKERIYGSKVTFTIEESMVMVQFLCKLCMTLFFLKLTQGISSRQFWVKMLLGYIVVGWVVTEVFYFGIWCRPFTNYFRVFDKNSPNCTTAQHHLIMSFAFNLSGDLLMLGVPLPMLLKSQLPWKRKAVITGILSCGIFVIISATLSRYYCFAKPNSILWIFWYVREASTAIIVANIPHLYALMRHVFHLGPFGSLVNRLTTRRPTFNQYSPASVELSSQRKRYAKDSSGIGRSESTENIAPKHGEPLQIWQHKEYNVKTDVIEDQWQQSVATSKSTVTSDTTDLGERGR